MGERNISNQVKDDPELLELMINDSHSFSELYRPTNFWENYEKIFLPELKSLGLHDFRRRKNSVLSSFGGTDELQSSVFEKILNKRRGSFKRRTLHFLLRNLLKNSKFKAMLSYVTKGYSGLNNDDLNLLCYEYAKSYGEHSQNAKPIKEFEASLIGNPENIFEIDKKKYTISLLNYYVVYCYCCRHMDFETINSMAEIGPGLGKQIEIIKKLHNNITFFLFDLPCQLYVAEQYLSAVFPDSIVSYRETRKMKEIPKNNEGKIFIFSPNKIQDISNLSYDMFFNHGSFQEMEPENVLNYLKYVNKQTNKYIFLGAAMGGREVASKKGQHGVLKKTTLEHYKKGWNDFHLQDLSTRIRIPKLSTIQSGRFSFWSKK